MSIYDTILANTQQGYQNLANQQMQIAQAPTFADRFLAGLKEREQIDYQRKMAESNLAMNQAYKQAQEENMRRQRVGDIYSGASKMTLDQAGLDAMVQRLQSMGESPEVASAMLPRPDESGIARGLEAQKAYDTNRQRIEHERNVQALNASRVELMKAQTDLAQADSAEKKALLQPKVDLAMGKVKMYEPLVQSQIYANYNQTQYAAPIQAIDPNTGQLVWLQPNIRQGGVAPITGYGAVEKGAKGKAVVSPEQTLANIADAKRIISQSSSGYIETGATKLAEGLGYSTEASRANAQLGVVGANLTLSVPRMEGPQSDKDRQLYEAAAANAADTTKPIETRLAGLDEMERITRRNMAAKKIGAVPTFRSPNDPGFSNLKPGDQFYDGNGNLRTR